MMLEEHKPVSASKSEFNKWLSYMHFSAVVFLFIIPLGNILAPLLLWLFKRDSIPELNAPAKDIINFQISMAVYTMIAGLLTVILIGFLLIPVLIILDVVYAIRGGLKASEGEIYKYPFTIQFIK